VPGARGTDRRIAGPSTRVGAAERKAMRQARRQRPADEPESEPEVDLNPEG